MPPPPGPPSRAGGDLGLLSGWAQTQGPRPRRGREGQPPPLLLPPRSPVSLQSQPVPPSGDIPGSFPRPSSSLPSPRPRAGCPPRKTAPPAHFFPHQGSPGKEKRRRLLASCRPGTLESTSDPTAGVCFPLHISTEI